MTGTLRGTTRAPRDAGTASPVPTSIRRMAQLAALAPVPSSLWRLPLMFGVSMGMDDAFMADMMGHPFWQRAGYLLALGVISDGLAFLTLGLVRSWGEVWPSWLPGLGGRRVPPAAAIVPAVIGGVAATALWSTVTLGWQSNMTHPYDGWTLLMTAAYAPLFVWGPLVLVVTAHYARRRRAEG